MTMNMKKDILLLTALAGVMAWTGCQIVEEEIVQQQPEEQVEQDAAQDAVPTWTLTVLAERGIGTKGLEVDGDQATATLLKSVWKADEPVEVYLGSTHIGTLAPVSPFTPPPVVSALSCDIEVPPTLTRVKPSASVKPFTLEPLFR